MDIISDDIGEYRARVELARLTSSTDTIHNSSHRHAAVLIEQLFLAAKSHVRILCRGLNSDVYGSPPVLAAAALFIARDGTRVEIVVPDSAALDFVTHPFLAAFGNKPNVDVRRMPVGLDPEIDFFVADESAYRFEPDPAVPIARASFNRAEIGTTLVGIFDVTRVHAHRLAA